MLTILHAPTHTKPPGIIQYSSGFSLRISWKVRCFQKLWTNAHGNNLRYIQKKKLKLTINITKAVIQLIYTKLVDEHGTGKPDVEK